MGDVFYFSFSWEVIWTRYDGTLSYSPLRKLSEEYCIFNGSTQRNRTAEVLATTYAELGSSLMGGISLVMAGEVVTGILVNKYFL